MKKSLYTIVMSLVLLVVACETDNYETGEGAYSQMLADLCELAIDGQKQGISFVTDDGDRYMLNEPLKGEWITTADTTYRMRLYYNRLAEGKAELVAAGSVATLVPIEHWRIAPQPQDPLGLESAWLSKSGKYLNLGILMKTGRISDEELPHNIGLVQDTIINHSNGQRTAYYRLLHSQNGIPEYYTNRRFVSILLPQATPLDTIYFSMQTYDGEWKRIFVK